MANKIKVTIDPGHSWNVNQGAIKTYYESNAMFDLAYQLKGQLELYGIFEVFVTKDVLKINPTLTQRANIALNNKSRLLFSLHSNACGTESVYRTVIYNSVKRQSNSDDVAKKLSDAIAGVLISHGQGVSGKIQYKANTYGTDYYGILRDAVVKDGLEYVMLLEHDFHTNTKACSMLLDSSIMEEIAKATAKVIYDALSKYYIADDVPFQNGTVTTTVNVRTGPGTSYLKLGSLSKGAIIQVVSKDPSSGWYKFVWNGAAAWVHNGYVTVPTPSLIPNDSDVNFGLPSGGKPSTPTVGTTEPQDLYAKYNIEHIDSAAWVTGDANGKVNCSDGLNVRSGPGTSYSKIGYLPCGTQVGILPRLYPLPSPDPMAGWHYIIYMDGNTRAEGFVFAEYIDAVVETCPKARVNATLGLNYRTGPSTSSTKVGTLPHNTTVWTLGTTNGWTKIRLSEEDYNVYYVSSQYLVEIADTNEESFWYSYQDCDYGKALSATKIYTSPSTDSSSIGNMVKDRIYCVASYAENDTWAKIVCAQEFGYVKVSDLNLILKSNKVLTQYKVEPSIKLMLEELPELSASEWFIKTLGATISSPYGTRVSPITGKSEFHTGIDFACPSGTPIYSDVDGLCTFNAFDSSCGNMVILLDEMGKQHRFYHMKSKGQPEVGEFVHAGSLVGYVGTTGDSTGNHLHYEVRVAPWGLGNTISPENISFQ